MLSSAYRILSDLGAPFISLYLLKRRAEGREDNLRFPERFGYASHLRPQGKIIWCHAASVGEAASILALIGKLRELYPHAGLLVTTGTVTSAKMLGNRLPQGAFHQYMPVDRAAYVARFLDFWKPDFAILIESELWPNMLNALRARIIPAALVNGRMSEKSFRNWYRFKSWAKELLSTFSIFLTQTEDARGRFIALGARPVQCLGNLKYAAAALPADETELARLKTEFDERPLWLLASSHPGEEELACEAHKKLRAIYPRLLTVIVPRHAVRGNEVANLIGRQGISFARRSKKEKIEKHTEIYLADTMGELGLFYRLCPLVVLGGSLVAVGGHNPIEPAQLNCTIIFGPHMYNFSAMAREFVYKHAAVQLHDGHEIGDAVNRLMGSPDERAAYIQAARALAEEKRHVLDEIVQALAPGLDAAVNKLA